MAIIGGQFIEAPRYGSRQMARHMLREDIAAGAIGSGAPAPLHPDAPKAPLYLVAIMGWHSRRVLNWQLSNFMDASFCIEALKKALTGYGAPGIFNSDQWPQSTSAEFTEVLPDARVKT